MIARDPMLLADFLALVYAPKHGKNRSDFGAVSHFAEYLKRPATVDDLNEETLTAHFRWLRDKSPFRNRTICNHRKHLMALAKSAYLEGLLPRLPLLVPKAAEMIDGRSRAKPLPHARRKANPRCLEVPAEATADMPLSAWCEFHCLERDHSPTHTRNLRYTARLVEDWHGARLPIGELTAELFNGWLKAMGERLSGGTLKSNRGNLLILWNAAADLGLVAYPIPRRLNKVKYQQSPPRAWSRADLRKVLDECDNLHGAFQSLSISRRLMMRAFVLCLWDTALRPWADLVRLERSWIDEDGTVAVQQSKTGRIVVCRLRQETLQAIDATFPPARELIFEPGPKALYYTWCVVRNEAGLKGVPKRGGPKVIRAARATDAERLQPGIAPRILGHVPGSQVAFKHYVDPRAVAGDIPEPPAIDEDEPPKASGKGGAA